MGRCQGYAEDACLTHLALPPHHASFFYSPCPVHSILGNIPCVEATGLVASSWVSHLYSSPLLRELGAHQVQGLSFESHLLLVRSQVLSLDIFLISGSWPHPEPQFLHLSL